MYMLFSWEMYLVAVLLNRSTLPFEAIEVETFFWKLSRQCDIFIWKTKYETNQTSKTNQPPPQKKPNYSPSNIKSNMQLNQAKSWKSQHNTPQILPQIYLSTKKKPVDYTQLCGDLYKPLQGNKDPC